MEHLLAIFVLLICLGVSFSPLFPDNVRALAVGVGICTNILYFILYVL